jgi:hypothetical protein
VAALKNLEQLDRGVFAPNSSGVFRRRDGRRYVSCIAG